MPETATATHPIVDVPTTPTSLQPVTSAAPEVLPAHEARRHDPRTSPEFTPFACSEETDKLIEALTAAALEFDAVVRNQRADVQSRREGARSYSYTYADLAAVISATRPSLAKHGLAFLQFPIVRSRTVTILNLLTHTSGQWMRNDLPCVCESQDPQAIGSAITYMRRYSQQSILNLAPETDDDGALAARRPPDRQGQGPVQMPQRVEHVPPHQPAQASAPPSASTTAATSATPAPSSGVRWVPGPLWIKALRKVPRAGKSPYWDVCLTDGKTDTVCSTFSTTLGSDLETWHGYEAKFGKAQVTTKGSYTYLDELRPL